MRSFGHGQDKPAPASWVVTFADLMTLLLTFFILLLSFSELDAEKYRKIAHSMSQAFGVSWAPESQTLPEVFPALVNSSADTGLAATSEEQTETDGNQPAIVVVKETVPMTIEQSHQQLADEALRRNDALATVLIRSLEQAIVEEMVAIRYDDKGVVISFTERASFPSGDVELRQYMRPVLLKVVDELVKCSGSILVMGHTDDRPIDSGRFRSNWDLSAARAVSVVHQLVLDGRLDVRRVSAVGLAETQPLVPNISDQNRAKNRRVEILVENAVCEFTVESE